MERVEYHIEIDRPVEDVYDQWTKFEAFPEFMPGVKAVEQLDDTHVRWHVDLWGRRESWNAEITEQQPDRRISWKSISGAWSAGTVRFEPLSAFRSCVRVAMAYQPRGAIEKAGDALGLVDSQVQRALNRFKQFVESRPTPTGGWRGEVNQSASQGQPL